MSRYPIVRPALGIVGGFPGPGLQPASRRLGLLSLPGVNDALGIPSGNAANQIGAAGYRLGNTVEVANGATEQEIIWIGGLKHYCRFKVTLSVNAASASNYVRFALYGRVENDDIVRYVSITDGNAAVLYVPGRALRVTAANSSGQALTVNYALDETEAGISEWFDTQQWVAQVVGPPYYETLDIPPFAKSFRVLCVSAAVAPPTLNAYSKSGALVFSEVLTVPDSGDIIVMPGLTYRLVPATDPYTFTVRYKCEG